jgi:hypothetical protein
MEIVLKEIDQSTALKETWTSRGISCDINVLMNVIGGAGGGETKYYNADIALGREIA